MMLTVGLLSACMNSVAKWDPDDYTVKSGDTVYSIAWRYELDPEDFAEWNGLRSSSIIKAGQRLHTRQPEGFVSRKKSSGTTVGKIIYKPRPTPRPTSGKQASASTSLTPYPAHWNYVKVRPGDTLSEISIRSGVSVQRLAQLNQLKKPYVIKPGQTIFLEPLQSSASARKKQPAQTKATRKPVVTSPSTSVASKPKTQSYRGPGTVTWQRPANGKIISKFNSKRNDAKGIEIAGRKGDAIVAAAKGKVVYSGDGLINYGNLVIIKHNNTFLSAYAYNQKLLVKEGELVKAGQKIAEMGKKDTASPRLHFEIRKNGKPVDPLKYLPR